MSHQEVIVRNFLSPTFTTVVRSVLIGCSSVMVLCQNIACPVNWGCRTYRLHLFRGVRSPPLPTERPGYDTKQSDAQVPVVLELWGIQSTHSLSSLPGPLLPGVVVPDRVSSMGQIGLNRVLILNGIAWNRTVLAFNCGQKLYSY